MGTLINFQDGDKLIWNASLKKDEQNRVVYRERTGANTAIVQRDGYEFEVYLDELENPPRR